MSSFRESRQVNQTSWSDFSRSSGTVRLYSPEGYLITNACFLAGSDEDYQNESDAADRTFAAYTGTGNYIVIVIGESAFIIPKLVAYRWRYLSMVLPHADKCEDKGAAVTLNLMKSEVVLLPNSDRGPTPVVDLTTMLIESGCNFNYHDIHYFPVIIGTRKLKSYTTSMTSEDLLAFKPFLELMAPSREYFIN
jgi:hypothetical protein